MGVTFARCRPLPSRRVKNTVISSMFEPKDVFTGRRLKQQENQEQIDRLEKTTSLEKTLSAGVMVRKALQNVGLMKIRNHTDKRSG